MGGREPDRILLIDEAKTLSRLDSFLRGELDRSGKNGFIVGLSGGVDSALVASCAVRTAGRKAVSTVNINPFGSFFRSNDNIELISGFLQIDCERVGFEYSSSKTASFKLLLGLVSRSGSLARFLYRLYSILAGETPFASALKIDKAEGPDSDSIKSKTLRLIGSWADSAFYAPHRIRRDILEDIARRRGLLPLGAANRSEWMVGWFVKGGIDDLPVQPLMGLYKTQFFQLAEYLGLPERIIEQTPSPDMMKGIDDEFALGTTYRKLDLILDYIERNGEEPPASGFGISRKEIEKVRDLINLSKWKRGPESADFAIDGSASSDLRI